MDSIEKLAIAMRKYCVGRTCRRRFLRELCDEHFTYQPSTDDWESAIVDMEDSYDTEE